MNKLESIKIENIKGIGHKKFDVNLFPNKPSIFVAPNGFGKSSIACAFESLKNSKLELDEKNYHLNNSSLVPKLTVTIDSNSFIADNSSNTIKSQFNYFVINSPLMAKATKRRIGGFTTATASLESEPIELISTIPDKCDFDYSISSMVSKFGKNGKVLPNIKTNLLKDKSFWNMFSKKADIQEFNKKITFLNLLTPIIDRINSLDGTALELRNYINVNELDSFSSITPLKNLSEIINNFGYSPTDSYLIAIEIAWLTQTKDFKNSLNYVLYTLDKEFYNELLESIDTTRHNISVTEKKKAKKGSKKKLIIEFPSADQMSNGQRDILSFIAQIQKARRDFTKEHCILIIDEVFDYLDDANLVAFQYYVTNMIEEFKEQSRFLYPILLTHLDPAYFKHFSFNKHKLQIRYLAKNSTGTPSVFLKIIKYRDDTTIKEKVSKYHFHFHPDEIDLENEFQLLGLRKAWGKSHNFYHEVYSEIDNYLNSRDYDAIAVLFAVRIKIEKTVFSLLHDPEHRRIFLDERNNGTKYKLEYCVEELGMAIPETFFLLGLIYNDNLHWNQHRDYETPLISKLENMTIKKMIEEIFV